MKKLNSWRFFFPSAIYSFIWNEILMESTYETKQGAGFILNIYTSVRWVSSFDFLFRDEIYRHVCNRHESENILISISECKSDLFI